jgi:hypothetical protein
VQRELAREQRNDFRMPLTRGVVQRRQTEAIAGQQRCTVREEQPDKSQVARVRCQCEGTDAVAVGLVEACAVRQEFSRSRQLQRGVWNRR